MDAPRSRRQTRAVVLDRLLVSGGLFRPRLAAECQLTEASISRIVAELKDDGLVEELRRPAPYAGGPSQIVALRKDQWVAGLDIAHQRVTIGTASLAGELGYLERAPLPSTAEPATITRVLEQGIATLAGWFDHRGMAPRRIAVAIPGYRGPGGPPNPIMALDAGWLAQRLGEVFPGVPVGLANAIAARAAILLHDRSVEPATQRQLFLHLGHGVGSAWLEPVGAAERIRPIELGHVVLDANGLPCRCGHAGCLETIASTTAIAALCDMDEREMIEAGDAWPELVRLTPRRLAALRKVLHRLGLVIGNALNAMPAGSVALSGWATALPEALRSAVAEGMDASLFGGLANVPVTIRFLGTSFAGEPRPALAYAMHELVHEGGMPRAPRQIVQRMAG